MADIDSGLPISRSRQQNALDHPIFITVSDGVEQLEIDSNGSAQTRLKDSAGSDIGVTSNPLAVSANNSQHDEDNPFYVSVVDAVSGDEIHDYDTAASVASGGTSDHTYTAAGGVFIWRRVLATASGAIKVEAKAGTPASEATVAVAFSSIANPNIDLEFNPPIEVADTDNALLVRTNREALAQDVYSTIIGSQKP